MLYKLEVRQTELPYGDTRYSWLSEPITIGIRHQNFTKPDEQWKNDLSRWAWETLGHRNWDWNLFETVSPCKNEHNMRSTRTMVFFLFEEKPDCVLAKLAWLGRMVTLPHKDIDDYIRNGETYEIQAD